MKSLQQEAEDVDKIINSRISKTEWEIKEITSKGKIILNN